MFRIIGITLLLIILVDNFYDSSASHAGFKLTKAHLRMCRCRYFPGGKMKCPIPLLPTGQAETQELVKCLCSKTHQHKFSKFKSACRSWRPDVPITLL